MDNLFELNADQQAAFDGVSAFLTYPTTRKYRVNGAAGTGKTVLIQRTAAAFPGGLVMSFTGRAVSMLAKRGLVEPMTIHRGVYVPDPSNEKLLLEMRAELAALIAATSLTSDEATRKATLRRYIDKLSQPKYILHETAPAGQADYIVLDEVSMVGPDLGEDVESFGKPIIVVGDNNQLPPIKGEAYFDDPVDAELTIPMRQKGTVGAAILDLATDIRLGNRVAGKAGRYGDNVILTKSDILKGAQFERALMEAGQVIAGMRRTCREINNLFLMMLDHKGILPDGREGEKLLCVHNNKSFGIYNGMPMLLSRNHPIEEVNKLAICAWIKPADSDGEFFEALIYRGHFDDTHRHDPDRDRVDDKRGLVELAWGYCITTHKAQGGEYPSVVVLDDGLYRTTWPNPDTRRRWLYTAATRPTDQLTIRRNV